MNYGSNFIFSQIATQVNSPFFVLFCFVQHDLLMAGITNCSPGIHSSVFTSWALTLMRMLANPDEKICLVRHPCAEMAVSHQELGYRASRRTTALQTERGRLRPQPFGLTLSLLSYLNVDIRCRCPALVGHHGNYCGLHFEKHCYGCCEIHTRDCEKQN